MQAKMWNYKVWITNTDCEFLPNKLSAMLDLAGFDVLQWIEHKFEPYGYTALWLLGESHLAVHTFPEHGKAYLELSSCVRPPFVEFKKLVEKELQITSG